ncbi:MAG TPA: DUF883 family protein [Candidatus Saccharimonadales bacterium]|nr:DUF883 family protein [Candidatus Saccharimonadales bacterium]
MNKHTRTSTANDVGTLAEDARELISATADLTGEKIAAARERLTEAVEAARDRALEAAKTTDKAIRSNPYQSVAIAFGVGAIAGYFLAKRK